MSIITPTTVLESFGPVMIPNINRSKKVNCLSTVSDILIVMH